MLKIKILAGKIMKSLFARVQFRERKQQTSENIEAYVTALRLIAQDCQFGENLGDHLRDQLVYGIANDDIRNKLFAEEISLTFKDVYDKAVSMEREVVELVKPVKLLNRKALSHESTYELERFKENKLIIFNHEEFIDRKKRYGTQKDVEALTNTFGKFGFKVDDCKNFTKDEIITKLKAFTDSKNDLSDYGCVAVAVLTHGNKDGLLRAKDDAYNETEIIEHLKDYNNKTLATKPRVIIIQACRGDEDPVAVNVSFSAPGTTSSCGAATVLPRNIVPKGVDDNMLILHSCFAGCPSYRNQVDGSWFIQELCEKINKLADTEDILTIMRNVLNEIAINKEIKEKNKKTCEININKQMPVITNTLGKKLYLRKYGEMSATVGPSEPNDEFVLSSSIADLNFNFLKICLTNYTEENQQDEFAAEYLELANSYGDSAKFNKPKMEWSEVILKHLLHNSSEYKSRKNVRLIIKINK